MDIHTVQPNVDFVEIFAQLEQSESELKKSAQASQRIAREKLIALTQENIHHLRDQHRQMGRAAWFSFALGLLGTCSQIATNVLAPAVGVAVSRAVSAALGALTALANTLNQANPFHSASGRAQLKAQEFDALAKIEARYLKSAEDQVQVSRDQRRRWHQDLEKILENKNKTEEAAIRA